MFETNEKGERIAEPAKRPGPGGAADIVYKETTRPLRWAVVVGTVDLRAVRQSVPGGPKAGDGPFWPARRIDLERQERRDDGGWSDWTPVDADANLALLDNLTEVEAECVRADARPEAFVDPLPFLKKGEWRGVDVEALVDPRRQNARVRGPPTSP